MKVVLFGAALFSASALAQNLPFLPTCAQTCALDAIGGSGCPTTNSTCICESHTFIASFSICVGVSCNATDAAAAASFGVQFCISAGVTLALPSVTSPAQTSSTIASVLQDTTQAATGSSMEPIPTILITTTDPAGNVFTITGEVLILGNITTTVPCRTVITTNAEGATITRTETGSSVLPTELQEQSLGSQTLTTPTAVSPSSAESPSIVTPTAGAGILNQSNAILVSAGLSCISVMILYLFS